jgi:hypothetical protein
MDELDHLLADIFDPLGIPTDAIPAVLVDASLCSVPCLLAYERRVVEHGTDQVVEVVGHATGQSADALQAQRPVQLSF